MKLSQMDDRIQGLETSDPVPSLHRMNITHESWLLMTWSQKLVRGHTVVASGSWLVKGSESAFQHLRRTSCRSTASLCLRPEFSVQPRAFPHPGWPAWKKYALVHISQCKRTEEIVGGRRKAGKCLLRTNLRSWYADVGCTLNFPPFTWIKNTAHWAKESQSP